MNLARLIEKYFNKVLVVSIVAGALSVVGYSYFTAESDYEKSLEFIVTHVRSVSESLVNAQNESAIDRDVNLVYAAWKKTQSLDFRIRVFLDDTLVAHAGQMASFTWPSTTMTKVERLPSNHNLKIEVQVSLLETVLTAMLSLLVVVTLLLVLFRVLKSNAARTVNEITSPLEARVLWLKMASAHLQDSIKTGYQAKASKITEMDELDKSLKYLFEQFQSYEKNLTRKSYDEGRLRTVNTVVHNLQNLFLIFEHRLKEASSLSGHDRNRFEDVLRQIQDLSSSVLIGENGQSANSFNLLESVSRVIDQRRETLDDDKIALALDISPEVSKDVFVAGARAEFEAALSNIIANSFDAIEGGGLVTVCVNFENSKVIIKVADTGKGIPADILPLLTVEGRTFKPGGNGLGLFHARSTIEKMQGSLEIESQVAKGTNVTLRIPTTITAVKKDCDSIPVRLPEGMTLVIVDDDHLVHSTFRMILKSYASAINIVSLFSELELDQWLAKNGPSEIGMRFYLFDYNLKSETTNGLKLIEKYDLALESLLVTGDADRPEIKAQAEKLKVRVVSKDKIEKIDFIFLGRSEPQEVAVTM